MTGFFLRKLVAGLLFASSSVTALAAGSERYVDVTDSHLLSTATGVNSMDGAAIDIDQDGDIDLVIAAEFAPNLLLINDGTGRLHDESAKRLPSNRHDSEDIAVADFDLDGDLDLIFVSEDDQTNEYYRNKGDATFELVQNGLPVRGTSNAIQTADFNEDGAPDLLIGNRGQNKLLINDGKGLFVDDTADRLPVDTATTQDLALVDLDLDGDLDIVEGNESQNRILINIGRGVFVDETSTRLPSVRDQTRDVEVADLDNDGDMDLLFGNVDFGGRGDATNRLLLNDGQGHFVDGVDLVQFSKLRTVDINAVDLNGDGLVDLLVGNRWNNFSELVFLQNVEGKFEEDVSFLPPLNDYTFDFQVADFNSDGIADIYMCNFQGPDRLLFGRPSD